MFFVIFQLIKLLTLNIYSIIIYFHEKRNNIKTISQKILIIVAKIPANFFNSFRIKLIMIKNMRI